MVLTHDWGSRRYNFNALYTHPICWRRRTWNDVSFNGWGDQLSHTWLACLCMQLLELIIEPLSLSLANSLLEIVHACACRSVLLVIHIAHATLTTMTFYHPTTHPMVGKLGRMCVSHTTTSPPMHKSLRSYSLSSQLVLNSLVPNHSPCTHVIVVVFIGC